VLVFDQVNKIIIKTYFVLLSKWYCSIFITIIQLRKSRHLMWDKLKSPL